jgi:hypothetical protein
MPSKRMKSELAPDVQASYLPDTRLSGMTLRQPLAATR